MTSCNAHKLYTPALAEPPAMYAATTSLLLLWLALWAKGVLAFCTDGCNIGCPCTTPFFTCNPHGGSCAYTACVGSCDLATWVIAIIVVVCVLIVGGCVVCCCGRQLRECCCSRRYTSTVGAQPPVGFYAALPPDKSTEMGARLLDPGSGTREAGRRATLTAKFCATCGARVDAAFCPRCGAPAPGST